MRAPGEGKGPSAAVAVRRISCSGAGMWGSANPAGREPDPCRDAGQGLCGLAIGQEQDQALGSRPRGGLSAADSPGAELESVGMVGTKRGTAVSAALRGPLRGISRHTLGSRQGRSSSALLAAPAAFSCCSFAPWWWWGAGGICTGSCWWQGAGVSGAAPRAGGW